MTPAVVSLVVCLSATPAVCETVAVPVQNDLTGQPPSMIECSVGPVAQVVARDWLAEHGGYVLKRAQCSWSNRPDLLRDRIESPRA